MHLVKGFYRRPLKVSGREDANGGGRVTQLVARPLLAALRPELSCLLQPLGGEYAGTRELLTSVPFAPGYGVEIGLLIDTYDRLGLDAIAQVNLGVRAHRNRPLTELGDDEPAGRRHAVCRGAASPTPASGLTQFFADGADFTPRVVGGVAGRPSADEHAAAALTRGGTAGLRNALAPLDRRHAGVVARQRRPVRQYRWRDADPAVLWCWCWSPRCCS